MPANLPPDYKKLEARYRAESDPELKLGLLKQMLATIPKHKGTEHLRGDLKKKLSALNKSLQTRTRRKGYAVRVDREGAGQVMLVGAPNVGKSALVDRFTRAQPEVAAYPFTTRMPVSGMLRHEDVPIQLVDLPPVCAQHTEVWLPSLVRNCDLVLLVVDVGRDDVLEQVDEARDALRSGAKVALVPPAKAGMTAEQVACKRTLLLANKWDLPDASERLELLTELLDEEYPVLPASLVSGEGLDELPGRLFGLLELIRVYSKAPGKEPDYTRPYTLPIGATLSEFATQVHQDFAQQLRYARVWGEGRIPGIRIGVDEVMRDRDVVELRT